jgi:hypothetical protein
MKTAMQELIFHIAYMGRRKYQDEQEKIIGGMNDCIMNDAIVIQNKVIEELTKEYAEYLEKEKEQIINARDSTASELMKNMEDVWILGKSEYKTRTPEEYYNQTYNQNK